MIIRSFLLYLCFLAVFSAGAQPGEKELIAREYMLAGEFDKAADLYDDIYKSNPTTYIYDNYLICLIETKRWKDAEKICSRQKKNNPSVPRFHVDEGYILQLSGDEKSAEKVFGNALAWALSSEQLTIELAEAFVGRELNDWAERTLQSGTKKFPSSGALTLQLALVYQRMNNTSAMIETYFSLLSFPLFGITEVQSRMQSLIMEDRDGSFTSALREKLLLKVQKDPSSFDFNRLLIWFYEQTGDFRKALLQAKAYDKRAKTDGDLTFDVATLCINSGYWQEAEEALLFVISLGEDRNLFFEANELLLEVKYLRLKASSQPDHAAFRSLATEIKTAVANTDFIRNRYALLMRLAEIEAYYLEQPDSALNHLEIIVSTSGYQPAEQAEAKLMQGDIMILQGDVWEGSLLYSQVEKAFKHDTLGFYAKFRNARLYYFLGEFDYAAAQLDILRGATSKLIANDAMELSLVIQDNVAYDSSYIPLETLARADLLIFSRNYNKALLTLDTILKSFPDHPVLDDAVYRKAQVYRLIKDSVAAVDALKVILSTYYLDILADNALLMLGDLYEKELKNKDEAMKYYLQLITDFPGSILSNEARQRYRTLRGDNIN